ncbi:hypothetical protein BCR34DRAFT_602378 [Clohesyomyces aquaticus]|uniref:Uncharacterized protein n=1 Tax=Clohesyomyces aquaticus TaxID=1231657 RepID=A0A1Y1ZIJ5_9PLEO|nr:hypothetical protein BCR34DRAFT_602378 [Clohesyomyces aquaticus]
MPIKDPLRAAQRSIATALASSIGVVAGPTSQHLGDWVGYAAAGRQAYAGTPKPHRANVDDWATDGWKACVSSPHFENADRGALRLPVSISPPSLISHPPMLCSSTPSPAKAPVIARCSIDGRAGNWPEASHVSDPGTMYRLCAMPTPAACRWSGAKSSINSDRAPTGRNSSPTVTSNQTF